MQHICVFAGSNYGNRPEYRQAAQALGQELVARGLGLVYGGASVGLMGVIADSVLARGGEVIGVIPRGLFKREFPHSGLTQLHEVGSMHERKALMADLADGFIALPGGFGTFDELFEISDRLVVIAQGRLSPSVPVREATVEMIGEWMSGLWAKEKAHA